MSIAKTRTAILISGRGSNMRSLATAARAGDYPAEIAVVISNVADADGLEWARSSGLETRAIPHAAFATRELFEAELQRVLVEAKVELVALAGFMRLLTPGFVELWRDRLVNIHPSLLPSFRGLDTHERALAAGVRITGCTVHLVRPDVDTGPIIAQAAVPVSDRDTAATLAARVLVAEHRLYPSALALLASGKVRVENEKAYMAEDIKPSGALFAPDC